MIAFRFLSIASRRFSAEPDNRPAAARMMLSSVLRIARVYLGDEETARIAVRTLTEDHKENAA